MWKLIPKLPAMLLVALVVLWVWGRVDRQRRWEQVRPLYGPTIPLGEVSSGSWEIEWPAWADRRGEPYLYVSGQGGLSGSSDGAGPIVLRVVPPDAVRLGSARSTDPQHWFAAGAGFDFDTVAWLDRDRARSVQFRLDRPLTTESGSARMRISGSEDSMIVEALTVGDALANMLALVVGCGLCVWFGVEFYGRWRREQRCRIEAATSCPPFSPGVR